MLVRVAQVLGIVAAVLRITTAALLLAGFWTVLAKVGSDARRRASWAIAALVLVAWQGGIWLLAIAGFFRAPGTRAVPIVPFAVILPLVIGLPLLARSRAVSAALDAGSPGFLIAVQTYRVMGAVFLVQYGLGRAPGAFAIPAGIGDVIVGLLAIPVARYVASRRAYATEVGLGWNVLGVIDLVNAVVLGGLVARGALSATGTGGAFAGIGEYPLVMIPAYTVPLSLLLHAQSVRQLVRARRTHVARSVGPGLPASVPG